MSSLPPQQVQASWQTAWPSLVAPDSFTGSFRSGTAAFRLLYENVTDEIREHASKKLWKIPELIYIEFLIAGFFKEYCGWKTPIPNELKTYLEVVESRSMYRAANLMAHAYLHMAYDLPRTIAAARQASPALPLHPSVAMERYLELKPVFEKVLHNNATAFRMFGVMAPFGFVLRGSWSLAAVIAKWAGEIRAVALSRSDIWLNPPPPHTKVTLEAGILSSMIKETERVLRRWWNPALWFRLSAAPPFLVSIPWLSYDVSLALSLQLLALLVFLYYVSCYVGLVKLANRMGNAVYHAVQLTEQRRGIVPPEVPPPIATA